MARVPMLAMALSAVLTSSSEKQAVHCAASCAAGMSQPALNQLHWLSVPKYIRSNNKNVHNGRIVMYNVQYENVQFGKIRNEMIMLT